MFRNGEIVDGRYRVLEEVGRGGYGTVFLAEELHPPHLFHTPAPNDKDTPLRRVALKVFTRVKADDDRFKREIAAMCRLEHPNIVPVFSFGRDRFLYLTMRYVDGIALNDRDLIEEQFSLRERIQQLIQVAEALAHAHERGVVDRDLKPHNILVDAHNHAWVVDFGLAWLLNPDESTSRKVGTPGYLAPELIEPCEFVPDHRADIYSLGATIHGVFAGHSPFRADGMLGTIRRQLSGQSTLSPKLPAALREIVLQCTQVDPTKRPRTAYDVADTLRHILQRMVVPSPDLQTLDLDVLPDTRTDLHYLRVESVETTQHPQRGEGMLMRLRAGIDQEPIGAFVWFDTPTRAARQAYQSFRMIRRGMTLHLLGAHIIENSRAQRFVALDPQTVPILDPEVPIPVTDVARAQGVTSGHCAQRAMLDWHAPRPFTRYIVEGGLAHDILEHLVTQKGDASSRKAFARAFVAGLKKRKLDCVASGIGDDDLQALQEKMAQHFQHLTAWLDTVPRDRRLAEVQRISARYGLEGRIDLVLQQPESVDIVELKTGRYIADEHEQQVRAYGMMWAQTSTRTHQRLRAQLVYSQIGKDRPVNLHNSDGKNSLLHARNGIINALHECAYGNDSEAPGAPRPPATPHYGEQPALCGDRPCRFRRDTCAGYQHMLDAPSPPERAVSLQRWYAHFDQLIAREYLTASRAMGQILTPGALEERIARGNAQRGIEILLLDEQTQTVHLRLKNGHVFQTGDRVVLHRDDGTDVLHFGRVTASEPNALDIACRGVSTLRDLPKDGWVLDQRPVRIGFRDAWRGIFNVLRAGRSDIEQWLLEPDTLAPPPHPEPIPANECALNHEQRQAVALGLNNTLPTVIQGPPGTGKTAVIAELVARLVSDGKRVLIATNTHAAADNVLARVVRRGVRSVFRVGGGVSNDPLVHSACAEAGISPDILSLRAFADGAATLHDIEDALAATNVFISTANAALRHPAFESLEAQDGKSTPGVERIFDVAIIDEASQLTEPLAAGIATRAHRMVLVGDDQQLPPVVVSKDGKASALTLPQELQNIGLGGLDTSLFSRLRDRAPTVMLKRQYRMNRGIQTFPSLSFYAGQLIAECADDTLDIHLDALSTYNGELQRRLHPHTASVWVDVGTHTDDRVHLEEARQVADTAQAFLDALTRSGQSLSIERVGIISPFRAQVRTIRRQLQERLGAQAKWVQVDTVERFQGRERDVILLSLASAQWSSFVFDARRLNVALTRARYKIVIFGPTELGTRMVEHFIPPGTLIDPTPKPLDDAPPSVRGNIGDRGL